MSAPPSSFKVDGEDKSDVCWHDSWHEGAGTEREREMEVDDEYDNDAGLEKQGITIVYCIFTSFLSRSFVRSFPFLHQRSAQ